MGVPSHVIAKIWAVVIAVPVVFILGYLLINYDSGTADPAILGGVKITYVDQYKSHVKNNTPITLKSLTLTCYPDASLQQYGFTTITVTGPVLDASRVRRKSAPKKGAESDGTPISEALPVQSLAQESETLPQEHSA